MNRKDRIEAALLHALRTVDALTEALALGNTEEVRVALETARNLVELIRDALNREETA